MRATTVLSDRPPVTRAPDNELYDRGCDLVEAATAIRRVADTPEAARAVPAVLGCIEAALRELLWAAAALEETSARTVAQQLWLHGLEGDTEVRAHAARLCEPSGRARRRRARINRGSFARRTRAGRWRYISSSAGTGRSASRPTDQRVWCAGNGRCTHLVHRGSRPWLHVVPLPLRDCSCGGFWLVRAWILHVACPVFDSADRRAIRSPPPGASSDSGAGSGIDSWCAALPRRLGHPVSSHELGETHWWMAIRCARAAACARSR